MKDEKSLFQYIIHPITIPDLIFKYWDCDYFHISRDDPNYYSEILTIEQMNEFLSRNDIRYPVVKMAKDGKEIPLESYSDILKFGKYASEGLINIDKLFDCFYKGATIIHQLMKYCLPSLSRFTNTLEKSFGFRVETTVYLTPEKSQGFTAHYDTHSVFVLQVYGSKTWRLYDNVKDMPTLDQHYEKSKYIETEPKHTIKLEPGDLLYVPRGLAHDAITSDGVSLHITLGVFPHLWIDYFSAAVQSLKGDIDFRKSPIGHVVGSVNDKKTFHELFAKFLAEIDIEDISNTFSDDIIRKQMIDNENRLSNFTLIDQINSESNLVRREQILFRVSQDANQVYLKFYNKELKYPLEYVDAINFATTNSKFKPKQMVGIKSEEDQISFSKELILQGFLMFE